MVTASGEILDVDTVVDAPRAVVWAATCPPVPTREIW